jgi:hypothetical protein
VRQKDRADEEAGKSGLGRRIRYHRALLLWPVRHGIGVYEHGLVLVIGPHAVPIPWAKITRVQNQEGRSQTTLSGLFFQTITIHRQHASTQIWLHGATAPMVPGHVWRHKQLARAIQAGINPGSGTAPARGDSPGPDRSDARS